MVRGWVPLIHRGVEQWNLLMEKISQTLVNTAGVQLDVKAVCGEMKRDFCALMANQQAGGAQVGAGAATSMALRAGQDVSFQGGAIGACSRRAEGLRKHRKASRRP